MKKRLIRVGLFVGVVVLFCWAIMTGVNSIAYAIESGDALGGLLQMGIPILSLLAYMYLTHKVTKRLNDKTPA